MRLLSARVTNAASCKRQLRNGKDLLSAVFDWRRSLENQQKDACAIVVVCAMAKVKGFSKPTKSDFVLYSVFL